MLAAGRRLRRSGDFTAAVRAGRRAGRGNVVVHLLIKDPTNPARAGFVVSRAVGNAVTRNRVRRRLRHLVRPHLAELPAGADLLVRVLPAAATQSYDQLGSDLAAAITAARTARAGARTVGTVRAGGGGSGG